MTLSMCVQIAGQHDSTAGSPFHHGWSVPMFVVLSLHSAVIQLEFLLCTPVVRSLTISCANVTVADPIEPSDVRIILYFFLFYSPPGSFFLSWTSFPLLKLPSPFPFLLPFFPLHSPSLSPLSRPSHCLPLPCLPSPSPSPSTPYRPLHILIMNAAVFGLSHGTTVDGVEKHFGVNHLGHFRLFQLLEDVIRESVTRIVVVSSDSHWSVDSFTQTHLIGFIQLSMYVWVMRNTPY